MHRNESTPSKRRLMTFGALICVAVISLGYFDDPPNGYTGAPGDDLCTECHSLGSGMQNGSIILNGIPATIIANTTYTLTVTVTNPNGIADFAGFQTVILDANNQNAGTMSNPSSGSTLESQGSRTYHEHNPAQSFPMSNAVSWTVNWTAPTGSGLITYYGAGNVANGNGNDNGDLIVSTSVSGTLFTPVQVAITDINDVSCFGDNDGSMTATATFGEPPYEYDWSNGGSGATITGLSAGTYTVTVTDNNNDTDVASGEVNEPALFEIASETINHVSCNGGNDGSIVLVLDGGTPPYTGAQGDVYTLSNLDADDYSINITDANGCLVTAEYTINEPPELSISIDVVIEPDCFGASNGLISVEGSGGTGNIEYQWSNGSTNNVIQNLEAGVYSVTIIDDNGCSVAETIVLGEPDAILIDLLSLENVSCFGANDGSILVEGSGGVGNLMYEWSNGSTSPSITGLDGGEYTLTVTDANGCTESMIFEIGEPATITGTITGTMNLSCFGDANGTLQVQPGGGVPPYTFLWSNGSGSQTINNLTAGSYSVTITDNNACTAVRAATITQPPQLLPNATATGETGPGEMDGTATSAPSGGVGPYTFLWSNGETTATITGLAVGTYTVTVTDANSCTAMQTVAVTGVNCALTVQVLTTDVLCFGDPSGTAQANISGASGPVEILWSNGEMTQLIVGLAAGLYSVTVTDTAGCIVATDATIGEPEALSSVCVAIGETMEDGNDGTITCTAAGGTAPYSFLWSNGDTTNVLTGLAPGTYFATITDANGCEHFDTATVNQFACLLQINLTLQMPTCFGDADGSAAVVISGGTSPYQILWSNGETGTSIDSLPAGAYGLTVTDADECVTEFPFNLTQPDPVTVIIDTVIHAVQGEGGAIHVTIHGGTPPYTTVWTRNGGLISTDEDINNLIPGDYQLEVIDANECVLAVGMVTITVTTGVKDNPELLQVKVWPNPVSDYIYLEVSGLSSSWKGTVISSNGQVIREITTSDLTEDSRGVRMNSQWLEAGLYYFKITETKGHQVVAFVKL